jgi:hypothetical protein
MLNTRSRNTRNYQNSLRVLTQNIRVNSNESSDRLNIPEGGFFNIPDTSFGPPMRPDDFMHESITVSNRTRINIPETPEFLNNVREIIQNLKSEKILTPYESKEEFECPLTLKLHKTGFILPCNHIFSDEILKWNKNTCPCCRAKY